MEVTPCFAEASQTCRDVSVRCWGCIHSYLTGDREPEKSLALGMFRKKKKKNIFETHTTSKQWQTGGQCHVTDLQKALTEQYFNFTMLKAVPHLIMCGFGDSIPWIFLKTKTLGFAICYMSETSWRTQKGRAKWSIVELAFILRSRSCFIYLIWCSLQPVWWKGRKGHSFA